jgi:hypothetical protein
MDASFDINLKLRGKEDEFLKYLNRNPSEQASGIILRVLAMLVAWVLVMTWMDA